MDEIELVRDIYRAMAERDLERLLSVVSEECVITQDPALPWGGYHVGHQGFAEFALALTGTISSRVTIDDVFAADGEVVQVGRTKGTVIANGAAFDLPEVHRWIIRDGQAVSAHFAIDTPGMLKALAAPAAQG